MAHGKIEARLSIRQVFQKMTMPLFTAWAITSLLNIMFGYDTTGFSGVQDIPAFERQFGTRVKDGGYALSASRVSFMNSIGFAGKFFGTLTAPFLVERFGHRHTMWAACVVTWIGIIVEATSSTVAQFVIGRIIIYFSVGLTEVAAPMYQAEISPASMRGTVCGSLQLFNQFGQITAAGINERFHLYTTRTGWVVPICAQAVAPFMASIGLFFIPDAPRWLLSKGRTDDAIRSLERVRPGTDKALGLCKAEAIAIQEALDNKFDKEPWINLFRGTNLRRTWVVCTVLALQQFTGQGFVSQYSPRFYKSVGLGKYAFDYSIASASAGAVGCLMGMILSDMVGRRDILIWGGIGQAIFLFLVAGIGEKSSLSSSDAQALVAGVILFFWIFTGTWPPVSYALAAEVGTASLREKTMGLGIAVNVISACIVAVVLPYLIKAIEAKIGWVFGSVAILAAAYAFFFVPETKSRSLEEMDELFAGHVSARRFQSIETSGAARRVTELETQNAERIESEFQNHSNKGPNAEAIENL